MQKYLVIYIYENLNICTQSQNIIMDKNIIIAWQIVNHFIHLIFIVYYMVDAWDTKEKKNPCPWHLVFFEGSGVGRWSQGERRINTISKWSNMINAVWKKKNNRGICSHFKQGSPHWGELWENTLNKVDREVTTWEKNSRQREKLV